MKETLTNSKRIELGLFSGSVVMSDGERIRLDKTETGYWVVRSAYGVPYDDLRIVEKCAGTHGTKLLYLQSSDMAQDVLKIIITLIGKRPINIKVLRVE